MTSHALIAAFALAFTIAACASSEQDAATVSPVAHADIGPATPEFHDAAIGGDTLRSRLDSDN